jgi:hypothetical protein
MSTREIELGDATEDEMNLGTVSPARSLLVQPIHSSMTMNLSGKKKTNRHPI